MERSANRSNRAFNGRGANRLTIAQKQKSQFAAFRAAQERNADLAANMDAFRPSFMHASPPESASTSRLSHARCRQARLEDFDGVAPVAKRLASMKPKKGKHTGTNGKHHQLPLAPILHAPNSAKRKMLAIVADGSNRHEPQGSPLSKIKQRKEAQPVRKPTNFTQASTPHQYMMSGALKVNKSIRHGGDVHDDQHEASDIHQSSAPGRRAFLSDREVSSETSLLEGFKEIPYATGGRTTGIANDDDFVDWSDDGLCDVDFPYQVATPVDGSHRQSKCPKRLEAHKEVIDYLQHGFEDISERIADTRAGPAGDRGRDTAQDQFELDGNDDASWLSFLSRGEVDIQ